MKLTAKLEKAMTPNVDKLNEVAKVLPKELVDSFKGNTLEFCSFVISAYCDMTGADFGKVYDAFHYDGAFQDYKDEISKQL